MHINSYSKLFIACVVPILLSCSGQPEVEVPEHVKETENLTVYQRPEHPDTLILHREQAFGDTDSILVGRIHDIAVDSLGRVFIADIQEHSINIYEPNGNFFTQLGRNGKGPGEFVILKWIDIRNNHLYAYDPNQQQVSIFTLDPLAVENTIPLARNRSDYQALHRAFPWINNLYVRNNHTYLAGFTISPDSVDLKTWKNETYKLLFYPLNKDGNISSKKFISLKEPHTKVGGLTDNIKVFFGKPVVTISSTNSIYLYEKTDHFLIKVYDPNGAYQRAFYYPHPTVPLTEKSAVEGGITGTHFRDQFLFEHMSSMDLPQNWPVLNDMKIDDQDRLWVSTTVQDMSVYRWWVLSPEGKVIARFIWPKEKSIEMIKDGKLYTRETNEQTGLQQVVRYRVEMEPTVEY